MKTKKSFYSKILLITLVAFIIVFWGIQSAALAVQPQVAAGDACTVGLKSNGTVVAVGSNQFGQLNIGNWTGIVQVDAGNHQGWEHTVGLNSDGTTVCVGLGGNGQCDVGSWTDIVQVAAGGLHTVGVKSNGSAVAVGANDQGQLNVNSWTDIVQVTAGEFHTVGVKSNGTVVAAGCENPDFDEGQCNVNSWTDIVQVAAGGFHTVGVKSDGTVVAVGWNVHGQLNVGSWTDIVQVVAAWGTTVGVKSDGTVVAVGLNNYGQVNVGSWADIVQVAAGGHHTVGLKSDGTVVAVGRNDAGQCNVFDWNLITISRVSFNSAIDSIPSLVKTVEGWDSFSDGTTFPNGTAVNGITYASSVGTTIVTDNFAYVSSPHTIGAYRPSSGADYFYCSDTITFTFDTPILAFGISFDTYSVNAGTYEIINEFGDVVASDYDPFPGLGTGQFAGLISDSPFQEITIRCTRGFEDTYALDDMIYAMPLTHPTLTMIYPNGGEILYKGNDYRIKWSWTNYEGLVRVHSYHKNKWFWTIAASEPVENGTEGIIFNPPENWKSDDRYKMVISTLDDQASDESDDYFSIEQYYEMDAGYPLDSDYYGIDHIWYNFCDPNYPGGEHKGMDIMVPSEKTVYAVCDGSVDLNRTDTESKKKYKDDYSRYFNAFLIIEHNCGGLELYGHYGHIKSNLKNGDTVSKGDPIGLIRESFNTNNQRTPNNDHLHFGVNTKKAVKSGWGIAPDGTTCEALAKKGWVDPITYFEWTME